MVQVLRSVHILTRFFLLFLFATLFALACGSFSNDQGGTVVIGLRADFDSLNELNAADTDAIQVIQHMLFMSLTRLDREMNFAPHLAERWEFSDSNRVLTYFIRKNVYWTDGRQTTADDVLFTYEIATNPKVAYPAASRFDLIDSLKKVDDYTIKVYLKQAYPDILFDMQIPVLPKHILGHLPADSIHTSSFNRAPVGNGPFKLVEWKANQAIIFAANDNFALGRPKLDQVVFSIIPDENLLLTNLKAGTIDLAPRLTPENVSHAQAPDIIIESFPGKIFTFVGWNLTHPDFSSTVRRALTHAIDKQEIIETLLGGYAIPAVGPLTPIAWAFDENLSDIQHNPERAKHLLARAGWLDSDNDGVLDKDNRRLEFVITVNSASQLRQDVAVLVQAQLGKIGARVHIQRLEWNSFINKVFAKSDFDAVILAWDTAFTVNPTDLWHSSAIENGYNFVSYSNPRVDALLELGRNASSREAAQPYWSEFQQIVINDCPYTFLFIQDNIVAYNNRLYGCEFDLRSLYVNIHEWWVE